MKTKSSIYSSLFIRALVSAAMWLGLCNLSRAADLWDIYQIAITNDSEYRSAEHEYARAKLDLPIARSAFFPALSVRGTDGSVTIRDKDSGAEQKRDDSQVNLNLQVPLFDYGLFTEIGSAKLKAKRAEIRFGEARNDLIIRVAERYFELLAARDNKQVARRQKLAIRRQKELASERFTVGLGTQTDLFDAQARYQQAIADEIQADNRISNATLSLKQVVGDMPQALAPLSDNAGLRRPVPQSVQAWVNDALTNNLGLRAADLDIKIAYKEVNKRRADRFPRIGFDINRQRREVENDVSNSVSTSPDGVTNTTTANATLTWKLFGGSSAYFKSKQALERFNATEQSREALRRRIETETTAAYLAASSGISQVRALSQAVRAGTSSLRGKEEGFRAGLTTNLDVLDAQRDLSRSRTDYLRAKYDFILSLLRLEQAVGDLDEDDIKRINAWLTNR